MYIPALTAQSLYISIYRMSLIRMLSLEVNCGYARTTIHNNSVTCLDGRYKKQVKPERNLNFRTQFSTLCPNFGIPSDYFDAKFKDKTSQFEKDCDKLIQAFQTKINRLHDSINIWRSFQLVNGLNCLHRKSLSIC